MSIRNLFRNQLSKVIEWKSQSPDLLWWKFPNVNDEIKNASKLIVAPGQGVVLVYEGEIVDIIDKEGIYALETGNHPFITTLINLRQNFESEHKLKIYFYRLAESVNQNWGTPQSVKYYDATYQMPVELGAYGSFSYRISDIKHLYTNFLGAKDEFTGQEMREVIMSRIVEDIVASLAERKYSFSDIDANLPQISEAVRQRLQAEYETLGLAITDFRILGTEFDAATKARIARVADVSVDVLAAKQAGLNYVDLERLRALRDAARNEGGLAGVGAQLGAGMEIGKMFNMEKEKAAAPSADAMETLKRLKILVDEKILTEEEFEAKKKELLNKL